jgi:hypothetical protein
MTTTKANTKTNSRANSKKGNSETIKAADVGQMPAEVLIDAPVDKVETIVAVTKASIANPILAEMFAKPEAERPARKDMILAIRKAAGLTPAGAATYLQNYKAKNGYTKPREVATA